MSEAIASPDTGFEVQQKHAGNWVYISVHSGRSEAVDIAKATFEQNQHVPVRVVWQMFDQERGRYVDKIIFRSQSPTDRRKLQETLQEMDISRRAQTRRHNESRRHSQKISQRRTTRQNLLFYARIVFVTLLSGGGVVALYTLGNIP